MNSYLVYRASFYLMLVVASLALIGDSTEGRFARLYPLAVTIGGIGAFFTVDLHRRWALPRPVANVLAVATLGLLYVEYKGDETQMIQSLGHWLIYLQLVKYFLPKTAEDDWFLFLLGLMQVLIGSVVNQSDQIGTWLFLWAMLAVWVLGQFFLQREARPTLAGATPDSGMVPVVAAERPVPRPVRCPVRAGDGARSGDDTGAGRAHLSGAAAPGRGNPLSDRRSHGAAPDRVRRRGSARPARRNPRERFGGDVRRINR